MREGVAERAEGTGSHTLLGLGKVWGERNSRRRLRGDWPVQSPGRVLQEGGLPDEGRLLVERSQTRMKRHCIHLAKRRSGRNAKGMAVRPQ